MSVAMTSVDRSKSNFNSLRSGAASQLRFDRYSSNPRPSRPTPTEDLHDELRVNASVMMRMGSRMMQTKLLSNVFRCWVLQHRLHLVRRDVMYKAFRRRIRDLMRGCIDSWKRVLWVWPHLRSHQEICFNRMLTRCARTTFLAWHTYCRSRRASCLYIVRGYYAYRRRHNHLLVQRMFGAWLFWWSQRQTSRDVTREYRDSQSSRISNFLVGVGRHHDQPVMEWAFRLWKVCVFSSHHVANAMRYARQRQEEATSRTLRCFRTSRAFVFIVLAFRLWNTVTRRNKDAHSIAERKIQQDNQALQRLCLLRWFALSPAGQAAEIRELKTELCEKESAWQEEMQAKISSTQEEQSENINHVYTKLSLRDAEMDALDTHYRNEMSKLVEQVELRQYEIDVLRREKDEEIGDLRVKAQTQRISDVDLTIEQQKISMMQEEYERPESMVSPLEQVEAEMVALKNEMSHERREMSQEIEAAKEYLIHMTDALKVEKRQSDHQRLLDRTAAARDSGAFRRQSLDARDWNSPISRRSAPASASDAFIGSPLTRRSVPNLSWLHPSSDLESDKLSPSQKSSFSPKISLQSPKQESNLHPQPRLSESHEVIQEEILLPEEVEQPLTEVYQSPERKSEAKRASEENRERRMRDKAYMDVPDDFSGGSQGEARERQSLIDLTPVQESREGEAREQGSVIDLPQEGEFWEKERDSREQRSLVDIFAMQETHEKPEKERDSREQRSVVELLGALLSEKESREKEEKERNSREQRSVMELLSALHPVQESREKERDSREQRSVVDLSPEQESREKERDSREERSAMDLSPDPGRREPREQERDSREQRSYMDLPPDPGRGEPREQERDAPRKRSTGDDVSIKSEKLERFSQVSVQQAPRREESSPDRLFARMSSLLPSAVVPVRMSVSEIVSESFTRDGTRPSRSPRSSSRIDMLENYTSGQSTDPSSVLELDSLPVTDRELLYTEDGPSEQVVLHQRPIGSEIISAERLEFSNAWKEERETLRKSQLARWEEPESSAPIERGRRLQSETHQRSEEAIQPPRLSASIEASRPSLRESLKRDRNELFGGVGVSDSATLIGETQEPSVRDRNISESRKSAPSVRARSESGSRKNPPSVRERSYSESRKNSISTKEREGSQSRALSSSGRDKELPVSPSVSHLSRRSSRSNREERKEKRKSSTGEEKLVVSICSQTFQYAPDPADNPVEIALAAFHNTRVNKMFFAKVSDGDYFFGRVHCRVNKEDESVIVVCPSGSYSLAEFVDKYEMEEFLAAEARFLEEEKRKRKKRKKEKEKRRQKEKMERKEG